ncbi:MAG: protease pro-enzyme activation domain-containing protein [Bryobacteraceae bacterium]
MTPSKQSIFAAALTLAAIGGLAPAQRTDRLAAGIHDQHKIRIHGSRNWRVEKLASSGPVDDSMRIQGISFRFRPTEAQQAELDHLLAEQQNPWSPLYHAWLTPEEFGDRFGLGASDYGKVREWVEAQGFQVDDAARSRTYIAFSGTAAQVRRAFLTDLHGFQVKGKMHFANVDEIALPAELETVISNVRGLDDFRAEREAPPAKQANINDGEHGVTPGDLAVIYDIKPLHDQGFNGAGVKIAVIGVSRFQLSDLRKFRKEFGLPVNDPQMILVPGWSDPGINEDVSEALLDVQYANAAAPAASLVFVYAPHVEVAIEFTVDRNLGQVISDSYSNCEADVLKVGRVARMRNIAQQATAQGMTFLADSGDTGPAGCEYQVRDKEGTGIAVSAPASVPEVTAVGGTMFDEQPGGNYWDPKAGMASAQSYIPEKAWNDTSATQGLAATSGGSSAVYPRPAWQVAPGMPNGNGRLVPDVSFTASWHHDAYLIVEDGDFVTAGGTSASTPFFAGVVALLNQYLVKTGAQVKPGLGNVNPRLYQLAQSAPAVFHDIVKGDNIVPCRAGTPGCTTGSYGYKAGPGYDMATGLGSIDVKKLFDNWLEPRKGSNVATQLTVTAAPAAISATGSALLTATVKAASGNDSPTGSVTFRLGQTAFGSTTLVGSGGIATATFAVAGKQLVAGANTITASYSGATGFEASSGSVVVTVTGQGGGSAVVPSVTPNPVYRQAPDENGDEWLYRVQLKEAAGVATKLTYFAIDGEDLSQHIAEWFGGVSLAANATLFGDFGSSGIDVPADLTFAFAGVDGNGQKWTKEISVAFRGPKDSGNSTPGAAMSLTSVPATVVKMGKGDPNCPATMPYYQKLVLEETNGVDVKLTKFIAAGNNYTSYIGTWFGSTTLPGKGKLTAGLCWQLDSVPVTLDYEMDGTDNSGKAVQATLSVEFKSLDQKSGDELPGAAVRTRRHGTTRGITAPRVARKDPK